MWTQMLNTLTLFTLILFCHLIIVSNSISTDHKVIDNNNPNQLKTQFEVAFRQQMNHLKTLLSQKSSKFDEYCRQLLKTSKQDFHLMFLQTFGLLYERHSNIFNNMFQDLEDYYINGNVDLADTLDTFFHRLYLKMFQVLNSQYKFDNNYLSCVSTHMDELKPFGDVPQKFSQEIKQTFIATRAFVKALSNGSDVIKNILEMPTSVECTNALTQMSYGPKCLQTSHELKLCANYCLNVVHTCLTFHTELDKEWNNYIDALILLATRLETTFNMESVVDPIDIKIAEAIMNFQENGLTVSNKLFDTCGKPYVEYKRKPRDVDHFEAPKFVEQPYVGNTTAAPLTSFHRLIQDIKKNIEGFWRQLPQTICNDKHFSTHISIDNWSCFNGPDTTLGTELNLETTGHNAIINEQNLTLKLIINKLNLAYNGQDVDLVDNYDAENDTDGSGCESDEDYNVVSNNVVTDDTYFNPFTPQTPYLTVEGDNLDLKTKSWSKTPKPNYPFQSKDLSFKSTLSLSLVLWTILLYLYECF